MPEPQVIVIKEDSPSYQSPTDPQIKYIAEDAPLPPAPTPPPPPARATVAQILAGLLSVADRANILGHLLTDEEKHLLDNATANSTPNTIVIRDNSGNIPGVTSGTARHVYLQTTPSTVWVITHNLNDFPEVVVLDSIGEEIIPDIEYTSNNVITIYHSAPYTGKVILT